MRLYFALVAGALIIAAVCGAALSWDGSYYLFATLDKQTPYAAEDRLTDLCLNWPALAASHLTEDFAALRLVFNLSYITIPLAALVVSWLIVRKKAPALFVWPALAIGVGTLPGQIFLIGEGIQVTQLGWPILLASLMRLPGRLLPIVVVFVAFVFVAHPTGSAVLGFSALVSAIIGLRYRHDRWKMWGWACGLAILAVVRFLRIYTESYDTGQMSLSLQMDHFHSSVAGMPLYALLFAWSAALIIFLSRHDRAVGNRAFARTLEVYGDAGALNLKASEHQISRMSKFVRFYGYTGVLAAGVILLVWAGNPHAWKGELDYKGLVLICCLPFMLLAAVEGILDYPGASDLEGRRLSGYRKGAIILSGIVYLAVLGTQSLVFAHLTSELRQDIRTNTSGCIPIYGEQALNDSLFTHWSVSSLALVLQSRKPRTVVLDTSTCAHAWYAGRVQLISWDPYSYITHWFNLELVRSRLSGAAASRTPSAAASATRSATASPTPSATILASPSATISPTRSATASPRPTATISASPVAAASSTRTAGLAQATVGIGLARRGLTPSWLPSAHLTQACRFQLTQGWYAPERIISGSWQWSSGEGRIRVTATHAMQVVLNAGLLAAGPRDTVNVVLNGKQVAQPTITAIGPAPIAPLTLQLRVGSNLLVLRSARPAVVRPNGNRPLAMAAVDFTLSLAPHGPVCASPEYDLPPVGIQTLHNLPSTVCTYAMSDGWYAVEQRNQLWWRWTSRAGVVRIRATRARSVFLTGYIASAHVPDSVDVLFDGRVAATIPVRLNTGYEAFTPVEIHLQPGVSTVTFRGRHAPGHIKGDTRSLAIAVYDLQIASKGNVPICALRS